MDRLKHHIVASVAVAITLFLGAASLASAQSSKTVDVSPNAGPSGNPQTVNAQQSGTWIVGIDPASNRVELSNTDVDPLPVRTVNARKPFQHRAVIGLGGDGFATVGIPVPVGKRLVIENITASARTPVGMRAEVHVITHFDNDGDGVSTLEDMTFHRVALLDQGVFQGLNVASANHKVLAYADSTIGGVPHAVRAQGRINGALPAGGFAQAHVTISGYLEDLTAGQ